MVKMPRFALTARAFKMATSEASSQLASQVQLDVIIVMLSVHF